MLNFLKVHAVKKKLEEVEAYLDKVLDFDHPEKRTDQSDPQYHELPAGNHWNRYERNPQ